MEFVQITVLLTVPEALNKLLQTGQMPLLKNFCFLCEVISRSKLFDNAASSTSKCTKGQHSK